MVCDVSPLDCADLLLGIPYQEARHAVYHATNHQYKLQHDGRTYVLTSSVSSSMQPSIGKAPTMRVNLNQSVSSCLVRPIKPDNLTNPVPPTMAPLLQEFCRCIHPTHRVASSTLCWTPHRSYSWCFLTQYPILSPWSSRGSVSAKCTLWDATGNHPFWVFTSATGTKIISSFYTLHFSTPSSSNCCFASSPRSHQTEAWQAAKTLVFSTWRLCVALVG